MQTYIALLRGINVSGQKRMKMADLRTHLASLGFSNLTTYIQSGNIVFQTKPKENEVLEALIQENILANYGFKVPVLVRSLPQWEEVVSQLPFNLTTADSSKIFVFFLHRAPANF